MNFRDGYRAQYFLRLLRETLCTLESELLKNSFTNLNASKIADQIGTQLALELDKIVLPCLVNEFHLAKNQGLLVGTSEENRYSSFFVHESDWTFTAKSLVKKYPLIFEHIQIILETSLRNLLLALKRFENDCKKFDVLQIQTSGVDVFEVSFLSSDRHRGGNQAILFVLSSGAKIIHKNVDMKAERVFDYYVKQLNLPYPFNQQTAQVLDCDSYGWVKYIPHTSLSTLKDLKLYYKRAGALIAICDSLNYTDGHFENLIASGTFPVLIDCETLFHCFGFTIADGISVSKERSVLQTGLVQKAPDEEGDRGYTAAIQTPVKQRFAFLYPHAINDRTTSIEIRYQGIVDEESQNSPCLNGEFQSPLEYIEEILEGYEFAYQSILSEWEMIYADQRWLNLIKATQFRQLIRTTLFYALLICKSHQPEYCTSKDFVLTMIKDQLIVSGDPEDVIEAYEVQDLLKLDVPYFYHYVTSNGIFDSNDELYSEYFPKSAFEEVFMNLSNMSDKHLGRNKQILRNVLAQSPRPGETIFRKNL